MRGPRGSQQMQAPKPKAELVKPSVGKKDNAGGPCRGLWTEEVMQNAIDTIKSGKLPIRKASKRDHFSRIQCFAYMEHG
ncbi:hypothetical protein M758_UG147100 [Ceratodon purpureus]|nr:hypothetical protein M758_UG147100 [Ceratodon purpureus]